MQESDEAPHFWRKNIIIPIRECGIHRHTKPGFQPLGFETLGDCGNQSAEFPLFARIDLLPINDDTRSVHFLQPRSQIVDERLLFLCASMGKPLHRLGHATTAIQIAQHGHELGMENSPNSFHVHSRIILNPDFGIFVGQPFRTKVSERRAVLFQGTKCGFIPISKKSRTDSITRNRCG